MRRIWLGVLTLCAVMAARVDAGDAKVHTVGKDGLKITGSIADDDPKVKVTEPNVNVTVELPAKIHLIKLEGGAKYRIDIIAPDIDPVLAIQDSAGKQLAFDDDGGGGLNSRLDFVAPADGTYKFVTASLKDAGAFTLTVVLTGAGGTPGAFKDMKIEGQVSKTDDPVAITNAAIDKKIGLIPGNMTVSLPAKLHQLKLEGGATYQLDVIPTDKVDPVIVVQDSTGKQLGFDDDGGGFPNSRFSLNATKTDTYKIFVGTIGGQGKYVLNIKRTAGGKTDPPAKLLEVPATGLKIDGKLGGAIKTITYNVKLEAGKTYVIDMISPNQNALDPFLKLFDSNGKLLAEDDDGGGDLNSRITYRPTATGVFRIQALPFAGAGDFTLEVRQE